MATTEGNPFLTMHRFRPFTLLAALSGAAALGVALPSLVQAQVPAAQVRALNLARNTAVTQNGRTEDWACIGPNPACLKQAPAVAPA